MALADGKRDRMRALFRKSPSIVISVWTHGDDEDEKLKSTITPRE